LAATHPARGGIRQSRKGGAERGEVGQSTTNIRTHFRSARTFGPVIPLRAAALEWGGSTALSAGDSSPSTDNAARTGVPAAHRDALVASLSANRSTRFCRADKSARQPKRRLVAALQKTTRLNLAGGFPGERGVSRLANSSSRTRPLTLSPRRAIFIARMPPFIRSFAIFCAIVLSMPAARADGPLQRVPNTTLTNFPSQPPQFGYTITNAFPGMSLNQPVCLTSPPGETNRLFIVEKPGSIVVITNLANPNRTVFMTLTVLSDSESGVLGLAFHPGYATNGYFFVFSSRSLTTAQGSGRHQCISRFQVSPTNPNLGLTNSELFLISQRDTAGNHNGGDLHFGPDGYLYASLGDEGPQYNGARHAQIITNKFFSAILRLDVDKRPGNRLPNPHPASTTNYFVPADNPYVGVTYFNGQTFNATAVRTEFCSIGYRNPWRMSFDPATGFLYVGDVGQDRYEEVSVITNGANAGWAYYEGNQLAKPLYPTQPTILTNPPPGLTFPIQDYAHGSGAFQGNSVSGGIVYRGGRISQLYGAYVFGDYTSGNIWMLRYDGVTTVPFQRIAGASGPVAFGRDPRNGDVLIAQLGNNQIGRLTYSSSSTGSPLPPTLAESGAFNDLTTLTPNPGIVAYDLNVPFWSDHALKTRWFSIPNTNLAMTFSPTGNWSFPTGTVWIKHFELELTNGVPQSRQRLETRFVIKNAGGVYGVTYRWDSATNATLVPEAGLDESFVIHEGGTIRTQVWRYPSRSECLACHTSLGGFAIGFNTAQLNRDYDYAGTLTNQIEALQLAGYFSNAVSNRYLLPALVHAMDPAVSLEYRVRSYLAANCVQCHQPGGIVSAMWDARLSTPGPFTGLINGELHNDFGNPNNRVIVPGSLSESVLFQRVANLGASHMPPLATAVLHQEAVDLLAAWITNDLPGYVSFAAWQSNYFGTTNAPGAGPEDDADGDGAKNYLEYLTQTNPTNSLSAWSISAALSNGTPQVFFPQTANRGFEVQSTPALESQNLWLPLNLPANRPFFSSSNRAAVVNDVPSADTNKFYRVRVFEP
jgi:glucose/arabinose dehydrogenase